MPVFSNEVTSFRELELHKIINEQGKKVIELQDKLAFIKLKNDEQMDRIDKLEEELCGRDNAVYTMNKRLLAFERKKCIETTESNNFEVLKLRETVEGLEMELQRKEIEIKTRDIRIMNLGTELKFREARAA